MPSEPPLHIAAPLFALVPNVDVCDAPVEQACNRVCRLVVRLLQVPIACVVLGHVHRHCVKGQVGLIEPWASQGFLSPSYGFWQHAINSGLHMQVEDAQTDRLLRTDPATLDLTIGAYLSVPLRGSDRRVFGSLNVIAHGARQWTSDDVDTLNDLAATVTAEIERWIEATNHVRLQRSAERSLAELATVQRIAHSINYSVKLNSVFETVVGEISGAFGYQLVSIYLRDGDGLALQAYVGYDHVLPFIRLNEAVSGRVARTGQPAFVRDAADDPDFITVAPGTKQAIIMPLVNGGRRIVGTLVVESTGTPTLTDDDFRILQVLADQVAVATTNAQLVRELREANNLLGGLLTHAPVPIHVVGTDMRVRLANQATQMLRPALTNIVGQHLHDLYPGDDGAFFVATNTALIETAQPITVEEFMDTAEGRRYFQTVKFPLFDAQGQIEAIGGISVDITARKEVETGLKQSEERLRALIDQAPIAIAIGRNGRPTHVNQAHLDLFGYSNLEEMLDTSSLERIAPEERQRVVEYMRRRAFGEPAPTAYETIGMRKDGTTFPCYMNVARITLSDGPATVVFTRDMTEEHKAQATRLDGERQRFELQKLESLSVLAGGIAHDFNNLLQVILGNAELLADVVPPTPLVHELVGTIRDSSMRAVALTAQMLAYSGRGHFELQPLDVATLVRWSVYQLRETIPASVQLELQLDDDLPAVMGDSVQLQQLVVNLVSNSVEACDKRGGIVRVSSTIEQAAWEASTMTVVPNHAERHVVLTVADTGCGMDQTTRNRMFEPFFTTKFIGRGLGLSAVLGIVRGHGGGLQVQTTPDAGTIIRVILPAIHAGVPPVVPAVAAPVAAPPSIILVIDDEPKVRNLVVRVVAREGWQTQYAADGEEGLELFRRHAPHVACVLLDLTMPRVSGDVAARAIQQISPHTPIIIMSGYGLKETAARLDDVQLAGCLQKPFTVEQLRTLLHAVCELPPTIRE